MGVVGIEPTQHKAPDLQSGPALQLRRTPLLLVMLQYFFVSLEGIEPPTPRVKT